MTLGTTVNIERVVPGERPLAVMARKTIISGSCLVLQDRDIRDLTGLDSTLDDVMTFLATDPLSRCMITVTKYCLEIII
jgi:hypothetical protein